MAAPKPAAPPAKRRFNVKRVVLIVVLLIGVEELGWSALWRATHPAKPSSNSPTVESAQKASVMPYPELVALAASVKQLQDQHRYVEALPGARRLLEQHELHGGLVSGMLVDYGRMLNNAAFEDSSSAPRSSLERVALERQALQSTETALGLAKTPRDRAEAITFVGLVHEAWGFPYDAVLTYRGAMSTDPSYALARQHYDLFVSRLSLATLQGPKW